MTLRSSGIKRKSRSKGESLRIYGPPARRAWVVSCPCITCNRTPSQNAHTVSGGMGYKAGYETIVPLCPDHHRELHQHGNRSFEKRYNVDLELAAIATEQQWQAYLARTR